MKNRAVTVAITVVAGLALAACGSHPDPIDAAELSVSQISEAGPQYEIDDLIMSWESATGDVCEASFSDKASYGAQRASCSSSSVLSVYDSTSAIKENLDSVDEGLRDTDMDSAWLVGSNWTVNEDRELLEDLQVELGGIIVMMGH